MTVYSTDLSQVLATIRETLVQRVAPDVADGTARLELGGVVEALDNLAERISWDQDRLARTIAATEDLAGELGLPPGTGDADVPALRSQRAAISASIADAYRATARTPEVVRAVADFTEFDVAEQISVALRAGLPD